MQQHRKRDWITRMSLVILNYLITAKKEIRKRKKDRSATGLHQDRNNDLIHFAVPTAMRPHKKGKIDLKDLPRDNNQHLLKTRRNLRKDNIPYRNQPVSQKLRDQEAPGKIKTETETKATGLRGQGHPKMIHRHDV